MKFPKGYRNFNSILKVAARGDLRAVQKILEADISILNLPSGGHNRTLLWEAVNAGKFDLIKYLVELGADVNIPGRYRSETMVLLKPYCIAHKKKKVQIRRYLIDHGHVMDPFSVAYGGTEKEMITKIVANKSSTNQQQKEDTLWKVTPLHFALAGQNMATAMVLLESGAAVEEHSRLLYEIACRNNRFDFVKLLTKYGGIPANADVPPVFHHNNKDVIRFFIDHDLDVDKPVGFGWPPIAYMARGDKGEHPEKMEALVRYVKKVNAKTPKGISAMHAASKAGFIKVLKVLVDVGGAINIRDNQGRTPLWYARKNNRDKVESFLKTLGGIV